MIKSLTLKNFRSHKNARLEFVKGVNCIIGKGMSGKSNIIRAIKLLCFYKPTGGRYKSNFSENETSLKIETYDGIKVKLNKGKNSKYTLIKDNKRLEFKKFGSSIPEEISNALGIQQINLQEQFDQSFIVFNTPIQITKTINEITNIDIVDKWISIINKKVRDNQAILNDSNIDLIEINQKIDKYKNIEDINPKLEKLDKIESKYTILAIDLESLKKLKFEIKNSYRKIKKIKKIKNRLEKISKEFSNIDESILKLDEIIKELKTIFKIIENISILKKEIKRNSERFFKELERNKKCPICLSDINSKAINRIKNEIYSNI